MGFSFCRFGRIIYKVNSEKQQLLKGIEMKIFKIVWNVFSTICTVAMLSTTGWLVGTKKGREYLDGSNKVLDEVLNDK